MRVPDLLQGAQRQAGDPSVAVRLSQLPLGEAANGPIVYSALGVDPSQTSETRNATKTKKAKGKPPSLWRWRDTCPVLDECWSSRLGGLLLIHRFSFRFSFFFNNVVLRAQTVWGNTEQLGAVNCMLYAKQYRTYTHVQDCSCLQTVAVLGVGGWV